jgi:hypothetical protein
MATLTQPNTENFLQGVHFKFVLQRTPALSYFAQTAAVPGISLPIAKQDSPFVTTPRPGHKMEFQDFTLDFIVDEKMENYLEIFNWITALGFPQDFGGYNRGAQLPFVKDPVFSDGSLFLLNSNKQPTLEISFKNMFPIALSSLNFDTTQPDLVYMTSSVTFTYLNFTVKTT